MVDVGGGSTGVGIIRGGMLIDVGDLPGGGHHLNLILAGALLSRRLGLPVLRESQSLLLAESWHAQRNGEIICGNS